MAEEKQNTKMSQKPITDLTGHTDINQLMQPGSEKRQEMQGFDDDYVDIVDYIIRSTHKIWEERGVGLIYTHYRHNASVHTAGGLVYGREDWIAATVNTISAYPDIRIYADDVIWCGNEKDGYHTSHRNTVVATNTGYSSYGPPTGRKFVRRGIANCFVKENRVCEEWVVRDEMAIVRQLGLDPQAVVAKAVQQPPLPGARPEQYGEIERVMGQTTPKMYQPQSPGKFDIEDFVQQTLHEVWNWRLFNKVYDNFVDNYQCHTAGDRDLVGLSDYLGFIMALMVAFPDAAYHVDHIYWPGNDDEGYRIAVRWTLQGTHHGPGLYGDPTGKRVNIMGISHFHIKNGKFVKEWTVFDEIALLKQLYTPPADSWLDDDIPF
ncbi:MAG: ester cyclase [Chloroflexi bacterium]|nr:ester cyclase [Chloroflexota bacterium]